MPIRPILELGNPLLRQPAQPIDAVQSAATQALIADLWDTLHDWRKQRGYGAALAAPVIGVSLRAIVMLFDEQPYVLINPRFEQWGRAQSAGYETCLAFNTIWGEVFRPASVVVAALDANGAERRYEADGPLARIMQHEIDHLDGLVWLDREPDPQSICTTGEYARQRGIDRLV